MKLIDRNLALILLLFFCGAGLVTKSLFMEPYKDASVIEELSKAFPSAVDSREYSDRYYAAREAQLTGKYIFEDYGLTLIELSLLVLALRRFYAARSLKDINTLKPPQNFGRVFALGVLSSFAAPMSGVAALARDADRGEFPPWSDSLGIPEAGFVATIPVLLVLTTIYSALAWWKYRKDAPISGAFKTNQRPHWSWWIVYGPPFLIALFLGSLQIGQGEPWGVVPSILFVSFFLCCFAGKQRVPQTPR